MSVANLMFFSGLTRCGDALVRTVFAEQPRYADMQITPELVYKGILVVQIRYRFIVMKRGEKLMKN